MKFLHMQVYFTGKELEVTPENMLEVFADNQIWGCMIYHVTEEEYESLKNGWGMNKPKNPIYSFVLNGGDPFRGGDEKRRDIGLFCPEFVGNTLTLSYPVDKDYGDTRSYAFMFKDNKVSPYASRYEMSKYSIENNECEIIDNYTHINNIRDIIKYSQCGKLFTTETIESLAKTMMKNCKKISYVDCSKTDVHPLLFDTPKDIEKREKIFQHLDPKGFHPRRSLYFTKKEAYQMVDEYEAHLFNVAEEKEMNKG